MRKRKCEVIKSEIWGGRELIIVHYVSVIGWGSF